MNPEIGQYRIVSLWFNGEQQREAARKFLKNLLELDEINAGFVLAPVEYEVLNANDPRLNDAKPPESGAQVLVATAQILDMKAMPAKDAGFIANLEPHDLERLRKATVRAYKKAYPGGSPLTQDQIDKLVGKLGPETAARITRAIH